MHRDVFLRVRSCGIAVNHKIFYNFCQRTVGVQNSVRQFGTDNIINPLRLCESMSRKRRMCVWERPCFGYSIVDINALQARTDELSLEDGLRASVLPKKHMQQYQVDPYKIDPLEAVQ